MKKMLSYLCFIPFISRLYRRKYYATGLGTYLLNSFCKVVLGINKGNLLVHYTSRVNSVRNISIEGGDENSSSYLSFATSGGCYYQAINGIRFGKGTIWAYNCAFISANHDFNDLSNHVTVPPIVIGENVWIGANCVILPSVEIGSNSIVGAGSVVTKSFASNSVIAGNPAKLLFSRCEHCGDRLTDKTCHCCGT